MNTPRTILLSVRPKWAELILAGRKTLEYRRRLPAGCYQHIHWAWLYETKPVGRIVARMTVRAWAGDVFDEQAGCLSRAEYDAYFRGAEFAYGIRIEWVDRLATPIALEDIGLSRAPQSWRYLPQEAGSRLILGAVFKGKGDLRYKLCRHCLGELPLEATE